MNKNIESVLEFAESLVHTNTGGYLSELQRIILLTTLQGDRKTYSEIADECGYSPKYIKQYVAPRLWQSLSQATGERVTKVNVKAVLEKRKRESDQDSPPNSSLNSAQNPSTPIEPKSSPPSPSPAGSDGEAPETDPDLGALPKANILLVDDQPHNLDLLSNLLEEQGYEVRQAINGSVALHAATLNHPDLILLDINMPEIDGYTVCQQLKTDAKTQDIPVIFVSALDEAWDKVKAFSVGGVDYITKPFKVIEVLARVENQLKIRSLQQVLQTHNSDLEMEKQLRLALEAQLRQANQELQRLQVLDTLTQTANRSRFETYLDAEWHRALAEQSPLTLMLGEVDDFDRYQTLNGEQAAADCLYQIAQVLKRVVQRPGDLVCRYDEAQYAIVLPNTQANSGQHLGGLMLKNVEALLLVSPNSTLSPYLSISVGVASTIPNPSLTPQDLIDLGHRALAQAKAEGGNRLAVQQI